ncbi:hypothetical protein BCR44DRAFT_1310368 [Catenaria anguillulae PL171]|uniref:Uncharacterized protein n=1 Tax=Catenaria anguillulae PL171 TaxID=765915 RepID=A0A1Y2HBT7_9FUNG|nr:hypothetical protein BCR44DRAFT_1310368 [Catenaria anguillulae PL171]
MGTSLCIIQRAAADSQTIMPLIAPPDQALEARPSRFPPSSPPPAPPATSSWINAAWKRRHDLAAMTVAAAVFLVGLGISLALFFWSRTTLREYHLGNLQRDCHALADQLSLDLTTRYGTQLRDIIGYIYTLSDVNVAIAEKYIKPASSAIPECDAIGIYPILSRDQVPLFQ